MVGEEISHYRILEELGAGGMGVVYRAHDRNLQRDVALKVITPGALGDPSARERFRKEALALSRLNHPNIATVYEFDSRDGTDFLVMELVHGTTLRDRLASAPFTEKEISAIGMQIAAALEEAHEKGVAHRDLTPGNIMLTPKGQAKVLDFGLARVLKPVSETASTDSSCETRSVAGTLPYMAPEQLRGERTDARTDIHALGAILYEMSSGRQPYSGNTGPGLMDAIMNRQPMGLRSLNPKLSTSLEGIVFKCLEKDPDNRYQSALELVVDLRRISMISAAAYIAHVRPSTHALLRSWKPLLLGAAMMLLAFLAVLWYLLPLGALSEQDVILVADFQNATGESLFEGSMLRDALEFKLMESPFLNLYPAEDIREALRLMERPADANIDEATGREICIRMGLQAMVTGSISSLGRNYLLQLKALTPKSGSIMAAAQVEADSKQDIVRQLGRAATDFRNKLGESMASIQQYDVPLERATTASLEALQAFSAGIRLRDQGRFEEARSQFKRAVDFDPEFALAHVQLANTYGNDNQMVLMREEATRAYELRQRASERERLEIEFNYHASVTEDLQRAVEVAETLARAYPRDWINRNNLGVYYRTLGRYEEAIEEFQAVLRLSPNSIGYGNSNIAWTYLFLNRFQRAEEYCDRALSAGFESVGSYQLKYYLAALRGDTESMAQQVRRFSGKPQEYLTERWRGDFAAFSGRIGEARRSYANAAQLAELRGLQDRVAIEWAWAALIDAQVGFCSDVDTRTDQAIDLSAEVSVLRDSALALAMCGRLERAEALIHRLETSRPQSTYVNGLLVPDLQAQLQIKRGRFQPAIDSLQPLIHFDRRAFGQRSIYLRGLAYLGLGESKAAVAEMRKILDSRGKEPLSILYPLAHLQIGRAAMMEGDLQKCREAYEDFFALWKNADPDIPILKTARNEYKKLR